MRTKIKCRLRACFIFVCALLLAIPNIPLYAEDSVQSLENTTSGLQGELSTLNSELAALSSEIDSAMENITTTTAQVEQTKVELATAQADEQQQYEDMKIRIQYMYEEGNSSLLELVFSAKSMADFLNRAEFVTTISEYDRNMLNQLHEVQNQVKAKEDALQAEQVALTTLKSNLDEKETALTSKISSTSGELAQYSDQLARAKAVAAAAQEVLNKPVTPAPVAPTPSQPEADAGGSSNNNNDNGGGSTTPGNPDASIDANDLELMAAILECEAGTDDYEALLAVGSVIMNRVNHSAYPNTIHGVIYQKGQFSPTWSGKLARVLARGAAPLCYDAGRDAMAGKNNIGDCLQFRMVGTPHQGITIGDNVFF